MPLVLIAVGKLKGASAYLKAGVDDYLKRLGAYDRVQLLEVPEETIAPSKTVDQIKLKEGERLLAAAAQFDGGGQSAYRIALSERGEQLDSAAFSARLLGGRNQLNGGVLVDGSTPIIVMVGGPLGLSGEVLEKSNWTLSLSSMTLPHPLVRLVLLEQLYRAFKIHRNEPYHK